MQEGTIDVQTLVAIDPEGVNVRYVITGGANRNLFRLDPANSPNLKFRTAPVFSTGGNNEYTVEAGVTTDFITIIRQTITVTVIEVNDTAPPLSFTSETTVEVAENSTGTVYTAATDRPATFTLGSSKDERFFNIDNTAITFRASPDYEFPTDTYAGAGSRAGDNIYVIDVIATDAAANVFTLEVSITVTDVEEVLGVDRAAALSIYPNPTGGAFSLHGGALADYAELTISDLTGKVLLTFSDLSGGTYDISSLKDGVYLVLLGSDSSSSKRQEYVGRVVKKSEIIR